MDRISRDLSKGVTPHFASISSSRTSLNLEGDDDGLSVG
jgi:hypothetical protein